MDNILNVILNTLFISLPEETIWVLLTLVFLGRFDLLDIYRWRENIKWIITLVLPTAIIINIFRYIIVIPQPFVTLICIATLVLLFIYVLTKNTVIKDDNIIIKVILYVLLSLIIITIVESVFVVFMLFILDNPIQFYFNNIVITFLLLLPVRIIQGLLVVFILKKESINKKVLLEIFRSKTLLTSIFTMLTTSVLFISYMIKLIGQDGILINLSLQAQILTTVLIIIVPSIFILLFFVMLNHFITQIILLQKSHQNMFDDDL